MKPSFFSLFKRGKYCRVKTGDSEEEVAREKREHKEAERFAVAAIAFCLEHDECFRKHFFEKVCRQNGDLPENNASSQIEEINWADLTIINEGRTYVVEFKIHASLEPKQDPDGTKFFEPDGYGLEMQNHGISRYTVLGCERKLNLGNATQKGKIICRECAWSILDNGLKLSKLTKDLFDCLGSLGVSHFKLMKIKNIRVKPELNEAINAFVVIDAINNALNNVRGEYDASHDSDNNWWLGFNISRTGNSENKSLANITGAEEWFAGWFGFQCDPDIGPQRAVWLYCLNETKAEEVCQRVKFENSFDKCKKRQRDGSKSGFDVIITSPFSQESADGEWFLEVFRKIGLNLQT
jgi:hypothetical protein